MLLFRWLKGTARGYTRPTGLGLADISSHYAAFAARLEVSVSEKSGRRIATPYLNWWGKAAALRTSPKSPFVLLGARVIGSAEAMLWRIFKMLRAGKGTAREYARPTSLGLTCVSSHYAAFAARLEVSVSEKSGRRTATPYREWWGKATALRTSPNSLPLRRLCGFAGGSCIGEIRASHSNALLWV